MTDLAFLKIRCAGGIAIALNCLLLWVLRSQPLPLRLTIREKLSRMPSLSCISARSDRRGKLPDSQSESLHSAHVELHAIGQDC
jgi:hypothetical protein